jgi:hypothetical protein
MNDLSSITRYRRGTYIQTLFDPVQTHAVYGVTADNLSEVKKELKALGATRFRVLKTGFGTLRIVCFKYSK